MFIDYHAEHQVFTDSLEKYLEKEIIPNVDAWEEAHFFPNEIFQKLGKEGYLGLLLPVEYGGIAEDYSFAAAWCETFGKVPVIGFTIGVNMHSLVIAPAIAKHGSISQQQKWLKKATAGDVIGAYAFTEPDAGSDLLSIRTTAKKFGNKYIINGAKTFITNGARADFVLVLTKTDLDQGTQGFTTFIVDTKSPGFKVARKLDKLGWHCSDTAELVFENVEVGEDCILGSEGQGWNLAMQSLNWERLMLSFTTLGAVKQCFHEAVAYTQERKAFGKKISEFDAVQSILSEMYRRIKISEGLVYFAFDKFLAGTDCRVEVALAKRYSADHSTWVADRAIQLHGGYGYTTEFRPERWWRDLRLMAIGGGTSEIMANIAAKKYLH